MIDPSNGGGVLLPLKKIYLPILTSNKSGCLFLAIDGGGERELSCFKITAISFWRSLTGSYENYSRKKK